MQDIEKINEQELENVAGGMVYNAAGTPEADPERPWEVIHNNNGQILGRYRTQEEACHAAKQYKSGSRYDTMIVSREIVDNLRANPQNF